MNINHLIRLANRIGDFFESLPDHAEGVEGVASHIQKYWAPRMRTAMLNYLEQHPDGRADEASLTPIALEAILINKERLTPKAAA